MSRKSSAAPAPKSQEAYHHGDLRAALIAAAREALETTRPEDITLKSLAVRVGVSQPAPYRHFANRDALLAAVAADGFVRFREAMETAQASAEEHGRFLAASLAYLEFGRANRGVYRLMFATRLVPTVDDAPLNDAARASFELLLEGVAQSAPPERVQAIAVWIWSTLHGLVMLEAEGILAGPSEHRVSAAEVVGQMMATFAALGGEGH
jgi:AcrR family transcriptional regulator